MFLSSFTGNVSLVSVRIAFSMLAKFAISAAFMIVFLYGPEIFPTTLRSRQIVLTCYAYVPPVGELNNAAVCLSVHPSVCPSPPAQNGAFETIVMSPATVLEGRELYRVGAGREPNKNWGLRKEFRFLKDPMRFDPILT